MRDLLEAYRTSIVQMFPVETERRKLDLVGIRFGETPDPSDLDAQNEAKKSGRDWSLPLHLKLRLIEKATGKTLDEKEVKFGNIPARTERNSFIMGGSEYFPIRQLRLRPGPYHRIKDNGNLEAQYNLARGRNFEIEMDPKTFQFSVHVGTRKFDLYNFMKLIGVDEERMRKTWGDEIFKENKASAGRMDPMAKKALNAFMPYGKDVNMDKMGETLRDYLKTTALDSDVAATTIGVRSDSVNPEMILKSSKKLIDLSAGETEPDNRNDLRFKKAVDIKDFVGERIRLSARDLTRRIKIHINSAEKVDDVIARNAIDQPIRTLFNQYALSQFSEQTNPIQILSQTDKVTVSGPGGIVKTEAITPQMRQMDLSHAGFLDPLFTSEQSPGSLLHTASRTRIRDGKLEAQLKNAATGSVQWFDPESIRKEYVLLPGQKPVKGKVTLLHEGRLVHDRPERATYRFGDSGDMFNPVSRLVPFLNTTQGFRASVGIKMSEQAVGLKDPDIPLVQSEIDGRPTIEVLARKIPSLVPVAPFDGTVTRVGKEIEIRGKDRTVRIPIYRNFHLAQENFIDSRPLVRDGDKVKEGQILADTNFTKDGKLAMGKNLRVGYVPWKGLNYEDGIVVSEGAARKMTSVHIQKVALKMDDDGLLSLQKYRAQFPTKLTNAQAEKLGNDGIINVGRRIEPGEILLSYMKKNEPTAEDIDLSKLKRTLYRPYLDMAVTWDEDYPGIVTDVVKTPDGVTVYVKTEEPLRIGDKLGGAYGDKGIVTAVIPDAEMPGTRDGKNMEILLNPITVVGRGNVGQVYETLAGKIAEKRGKPFMAETLAQNAADRMADELKKSGLDDQDELVDPKTGRSLGKVMTGVRNIYKLRHQIKHKFSARGLEGAYTAEGQPAKGGGESAQTLDQLTEFSLLAHGARENIRDILHSKSEKNDELFRALSYGEPIPPPRHSAVYEKFVSFLKGSGIDIQRKGDNLFLLPMTDKKILSMSNGALKAPLLVRAKDLRPEAGGLFDLKLTGGLKGERWTHVPLASPVPNPSMMDAIAGVLELTKKEVEGVYFSEGGSDRLMDRLRKIDVDADLEKARAAVSGASPSRLDKLNKKIRFLSSLKRMDLSPTDYMLNNVPVIPPTFRPLYPKDDLVIVSDANKLYQNVILANEQLKRKDLPESEKTRVRKDLFRAVSELTGITQPDNRKESYKGFLRQIAGDHPKSGMFIGKVIRKPILLAGRSTITVGNDLNIDEVGIPYDMAKEIYQPFIVRSLVNRGYNAVDAEKMLEDNHPAVKDTVYEVVKERPVLLNRSPSLHKFSIMALQPKIVPGKDIRIPPLIVTGFNADHDGDCQHGSVITCIPRARYNADYDWNRYPMTATMRTMIPSMDQSGDVFIFHLEEFPHGRLVKRIRGRNGLIEVYDALKGIRVLSLDEQSGRLRWASVSHWSKHFRRKMEIVTLLSGRQILSDDDPRAVYGIVPGTLEHVRMNPRDACRARMLVPRTVAFSMEKSRSVFHSRERHLRHSMSLRVNKWTRKMVLDENLGWFIGAMAGDGWVIMNRGTPKGIALAATVNSIKDKWSSIALSMTSRLAPITTRERKSPGLGSRSRKCVFSSTDAGRLFLRLIGLKSQGKHLPAFYLSGPKPFRSGLLAGLMDTDGNISISKARGKKPQLMCSYSTSSIRLAHEVQMVAMSLGIRSGIIPGKTPKGEPCWTVGLSNYGMKYLWGGAGLVHPGKRKIIRMIDIKHSPVMARQDIVPISLDLSRWIMDILGAHRNASKSKRSLYAILSKSKRNGFVTRWAAKAILDFIPEHRAGKCAGWNKWRSIVSNDSITWDRVKAFKETGIVEDGYDLSVPGTETFMNVDGTILSNTMFVSVPVSKKAAEEARAMLPSANLLSPRGSGTWVLPRHEYFLSLYNMTKPGRTTSFSFDGTEDAMKAWRKNKFELNDTIALRGKRTSLGRILVNRAIPEQYRDDEITMSNKKLRGMLDEIAKEKPDQFPQTVRKLTDLASEYVQFTGISMGLKDFMSDPLKDSIVERAVRRVSTAKDRSAAIQEAAVESEARAAEKARDEKDFTSMVVHSGARGNKTLLKNMLIAPIASMDPTGRPFQHVVKSNLSEGMSPDDFLLHSFDARKTLVEAKEAIRVPGTVNKELLNSVAPMTITMEDCGTRNGILRSIDDNDIFDRYAAGDASLSRNTMITSRIVRELKKRKIRSIKVRSPLTCDASQGICQKCFGLEETGNLPKIGLPMGIKSGQTLTEPLTQTALRFKHTTGAAAAKAQFAAGLPAIKKLLEMPEKMTNRAVISMDDGKVESITSGPARTRVVEIEKKKYRVPAGLDVSVKPGQFVKRGDPLSEGFIHPKDLLKAKGIRAVQDYLSDTLENIYKQGGLDINRRHFEVVTRGLTNLTQIKNPGTSFFQPGDYADLSYVKQLNRGGPTRTDFSVSGALGKKYGRYAPGTVVTDEIASDLMRQGFREVDLKHGGITHEPMLKGINTLSLSTQDWLARAGYQRIQKALTQAAQEARGAKIHGYNPIPALGYGLEFGEGTLGAF